MALKIYIFIILLLLFGLIESVYAFDGTGNPDKLIVFQTELLVADTFGKPAEYWDPDSMAGPDTVAACAPSVVINELMTDPSPVIGLPDREYIELYNSGISAVNLKGWLLGFGSKQKSLPDVIIHPGGFLLLTATGGTKDFQSFGKVAEVSGLTLANAGVTVTLTDTRKTVIDRVEYLPAMHTSQYRDGGYSLERIDPLRLCGQHYNWETTLSLSGGTPGTENSVRAVNRDVTAPEILSTTFLNTSELEIQFSERFHFRGAPLDGLLNLPFYTVVDSILQDQISCSLKIYFRPSTILNGINYIMILHGLEDECGNGMADQTVKFGYYNPVRSDILINEVLFNPYPDGSDFVEIYNNTIHEVDLSGLFLATRGEDKMLRQVTQLSPSQVYMAPGSYLAVTKSIPGVERFYLLKCPDCLVQVSKFPSLTDESGSVVLLGRNQDIIDEMAYDAKMHHPFITEKEGISLEKVNLSVSSGQRDNWHSAAKSSGFATPGYSNSVQAIPDTAGNFVTVEPTVFSPNGDGFNDRLTFRLNGVKPGELVNITIFDPEGREVRCLANNLTTGMTDQISWDGSDSGYRKVQPGIYILNISLFDPKGRHRTRKIACVVTDRL